jgi:hypothetical protein
MLALVAMFWPAMDMGWRIAAMMLWAMPFLCTELDAPVHN